jgi:hypothetical protein
MMMHSRRVAASGACVVQLLWLRHVLLLLLLQS